MGEVNPDEVTEADVTRLLDRLYDPLHPPDDQPYRGSVYERADQIIRGAYAHYDVDLHKLAILKQGNPITEDMFLNIGWWWCVLRLRQ